MNQLDHVTPQKRDMSDDFFFEREQNLVSNHLKKKDKQ